MTRCRCDDESDGWVICPVHGLDLELADEIGEEQLVDHLLGCGDE